MMSQGKSQRWDKPLMSGNRLLSGESLLWGVCLFWSLFQLWVASPIPFEFGIGVFNSTETRIIHLLLALTCCFLILNERPDNRRAVHQVLFKLTFIVVSAISCLYLIFNYTELALRSGAPVSTDILMGVSGIVCLLMAIKMALGRALLIVCIVFLLYAYFGPWMPELLEHKGASLNKLVSHQWLTTEGIFGVAVGVSAGFVFLFVLFGALLEKAGAGDFFIRLSVSALGHLKGGPAKAAVVASGFSGIASGSSIANVVTTGTFTIPLMKKVGFPGEKAAAIEVAASTNGQLTPPIMGAAAFLMVEYVGISYIEVIRHALLPALVSYIALFYIVHLEACKSQMSVVNKEKTGLLSDLAIRTNLKVPLKLLGVLTGFLLFSLLYAAAHFLVLPIVSFFHQSYWIPRLIVAGLLIAAYLYFVYLSIHLKRRYPLLEKPIAESYNAKHQLEAGTVLLSGLHYLLPVAVLIWCLAIERLSPALSAFWSIILLSIIIITKPVVSQFFEPQRQISFARGVLFSGFSDLLDGMVAGARNMVPIAIATAGAGIVVGVVTLTGIGLVMVEIVETISGGNLILVLVFTAIICLILGMGLPTTANYIVVSTLMAPVILELGSQNGLEVPLIAVHLFVFYFGILADDTPPVGLAAIAGAGIAQSDPLKTGIQGFTYDIRTAILPFMFIFNTELILIGVEGPLAYFFTFASAVIAMLLFSAATQGYWFTKCRVPEVLLLLFLSFCFFRTDFIAEKFSDENKVVEVSNQSIAASYTEDVLIYFEGESLEGEMQTKSLKFAPGNLTLSQNIESAGITLLDNNEVDAVGFDSLAQQIGIEWGWRLVKIEQVSPTINRHLFLIPLLLITLIFALINLKRENKP